MTMDVPSPGDGTNGDGGDDYTNYVLCTFDTNQLWLEITNVANGLACFNLHNSTNQVYAVWGTTDLLAGWNVEMELWPDTNQNQTVTPFTVPTLERQNLFLRVEDWTGVDSDGDGIPDWWIWKYFGNLTETATNWDATGKKTLGYDYTNGVDPNIIIFAVQFTNQYVSTQSPSGTLIIHGGVPSYYAVLVDDDNQNDAVWQPYTSSNVTVNLSSTDAVYNVAIGLRGLPADAQQAWQPVQLVLATTPLVVVITNPPANVVAQSTVQLQGYVVGPLTSLSFDVSNAAGLWTNQSGFFVSQFDDISSSLATTNYFECPDIALQEGGNVITLHAANRAGNTTSVSYSLDYAPTTNAPSLTVLWPQDGSQISDNSFTVQAQTDDNTGTVTAVITDGNGNTNTASGVVEQNGTVWVKDLPLAAGANELTLTVQNGSGSNTTNLTVYQGSVLVTVDPLTPDQLNQTSVIVTGTISDPSDRVTVNTVEASVDEEGNWEADGVSANATGTAVLDVEVYAASQNQSRMVSLVGRGQTFGPQDASDSTALCSQRLPLAQPPTVAIASYYEHDARSSACPVYNIIQYASGDTTINWLAGFGGSSGNVGCYSPLVDNLGAFAFSDSIGPDEGGFSWVNASTSWSTDCGNYQYQIKTHVKLVGSGQEPAGQTNLYLVSAQVIDEDSGLQLPGSQVQIRGTTLMDVTNDDGSVWSNALVQKRAGVNSDVTPQTSRNNSFNGMQVQDVKLKIIDANTFNNVTDQTNSVIVGRQVSLFCELTVPIRTNWTFGNFSWTVPGTIFLNYVADAQSGVLYTNIYTNLQSVVFYWADGASNRVIQCSAKVNGQTVTAITTFNVLRPTAKIITTGGTVAITLDTNSDTTIHCGLPQVGSVGMLFSPTVTPPSGYSGNINLRWVQKVSSLLRRVQTDDSPPAWYREQATNVLDVSYPYPFNPYPCTSDSPSSTGLSPYQTVSYSDSFEMWLMFKPDGGQWVPLRKVAWHWDGAGSKYGATWTLDSHTDPGNPDDTDTTAFPTWTDNMSNHFNFQKE